MRLTSSPVASAGPLVALDSGTPGEVLALVAGPQLWFSQLNHAVAKLPPGGIFKPFVYATAMKYRAETAALRC